MSRIKVIPPGLDGAELRREKYTNSNFVVSNDNDATPSLKDADKQCRVHQYTINGTDWERIFGVNDGKRRS